ncbi:MAG: adenine phosphoribosyltransferase [Rhodothalassiaceae bacterium]
MDKPAPISAAAHGEDWIVSRIRTIPDFPKPGIQFRDITTLLNDARGFRRAVDALVAPYKGVTVDKVAGIEARGFILGGAVAHQLDAAFVPVRKKGKLPHTTLTQDYDLEYGTDTLEIHEDSIAHGDLVLLVDDLIATGGTAEASVNLIRRAGGIVVACCFVIDLPDLGGAARLRAMGLDVVALCGFPGD